MNFRSDKPIGLQIKESAAKLGVSLAEISRRSGVKRDTLERMKRNDMLTITNLKSIQKTIDEIVTEKTLSLITKKQDNDGDWYWIPNTKIGQFDHDNLQLSGKEYMNCPDKFDQFQKDFGHYLTGVDPDLIPEILLKNPICLH